MSLPGFSKLKNKLSSGPADSVSPSSAFGAEKQTEEEIRRQHYVSPKAPAPGFFKRAVPDADRHSIENKSPSFSSVKTEAPAESKNFPLSQPFYPYNPVPMYTPNAYFTPSDFGVSGNTGYHSPYSPDNYPYASDIGSAPMYPDPREFAYYSPAADIPQNYCNPQIPSYPPYSPQTQEPGMYIPQDINSGYSDPSYFVQPDYPYPSNYAPSRKSAREPMDPEDVKYCLWSVSIVAGMVLTLASFIYACAI